MGRYASIDCPVCKRPLENGEEIVVCPECGAPYHKKCYLATGHCLYPELHERGESWQPPRTKEETYDGNAPLRCSRCGTINPPHGIFCQVCGNKLNDKPVPDTEHTAAGAGSPFPPSSGASGTPGTPFGGAFTGPGTGGFPPGMPLNPFTTPYGGVAPDEEIDGIPAKELAIFTGRNSHYFLPRFKDIANSRGKAINWGAFLFHGMYFLYRKMYWIAIVLLIFYLLCSVPSTLLTLKLLSETTGLVDFSIGASESTLTTISYLCSFLMLVVRFLCGLFANTLYLGHAKKKIRAEKAVPRSEDEFYAVLSRKGGVATKLIVGLVIAYGAISIVSMYLTAWLISFV